MIVSNITKQDHDVTVELDPSNFDLAGKSPRDMMRDRPVELEGHTLRTTVGAEDFMLIAIR